MIGPTPASAQVSDTSSTCAHQSQPRPGIAEAHEDAGVAAIAAQVNRGDFVVVTVPRQFARPGGTAVSGDLRNVAAGRVDVVVADRKVE